MDYKGYILDQAEVFDKERGWHFYGVISNVSIDFTCTGDTQAELEDNFKLLVDDNFDLLQSITESFDFDVCTELMSKILEIDAYKGMSFSEAAYRILIDNIMYGELESE